MSENENENTAPSQEELEQTKAQLQEEQRAKAAAEELLAGKDTRITELQAEGEALRAERSNLQGSLSEAQQESEAKHKELQTSVAELATLKEAKDQAVAKYLNMAKALNSGIPEDIIAGETIEEIDRSVERGKAIVEAVKASMESEAAAARVPAGAPARGTISLEGLSPRDKIAYGIQQKGGAQ